MNNPDRKKYWYQGMEQALASISEFVFRIKKFQAEDPKEVCRQVAAAARNLTDLQREALEKRLLASVRSAPVTISIHGNSFYITNSGESYTITIST